MIYSNQVTFPRLMEDKAFRRFTFTDPHDPDGTNWRIYAQRKEGGPWARRDFKSWKKAAKFLRAHWSEWHDCALISRNWSSDAPTETVKRGKRTVRVWTKWLRLRGHHWCRYCRRPTVFREFSKHHFNPGGFVMPNIRRCTICGVGERASNIQQPTKG